MFWAESVWVTRPCGEGRREAAARGVQARRRLIVGAPLIPQPLLRKGEGESRAWAPSWFAVVVGDVLFDVHRIVKDAEDVEALRVKAKQDEVARLLGRCAARAGVAQVEEI